MRLEHPYCIVDQALSPEDCARAIDTGQATDSMTAEVGFDATNTVRSSTVSWLGQTAENDWLFKHLVQLVNDANSRLWKWQISAVESAQFTQYGPEQHYSWHADQRRKPYPPDDKRWPGLLRKLSVSICLADDDDFEGGDFMIETLEAGPDTPDKRLKTLSEVRKKGAAVIFPSHLYHRVTPVTLGLRRSLVAWFLGPPFI